MYVMKNAIKFHSGWLSKMAVGNYNYKQRLWSNILKIKYLLLNYNNFNIGVMRLKSHRFNFQIFIYGEKF